MLLPWSVTAILIRSIEMLKIADVIVVLTNGGPGIATESLTLYAYRVGVVNFDLGYAATLPFRWLSLRPLSRQSFWLATRRLVERADMTRLRHKIPVWRIAMQVVWFIIVFFPLYWMAITAFKERPDVFPLPTFIPWVDFTPTLSAFRTVFGQYRSQLFNALANSAIASLVGASIATFAGALAGYGLARFDYRKFGWKNDDMAFFFISQRMMPPVAVVFPFLLMYRYAGVLDRAWSLGHCLCAVQPAAGNLDHARRVPRGAGGGRGKRPGGRLHPARRLLQDIAADRASRAW